MSKYKSWGMYLVRMLIDNRLMQTQEQIDRYILALMNIQLWKSTRLKPEYLEDLFYGLDDDTEHIPPMQHLQLYIESHEINLLTDTLLKVTPIHIERASWWLEHFYLRLLVSPDAEGILKQKFYHLPVEHKQLVETMLWRVLKWFEDNTAEDKEIYQDLQPRIRAVLGNREDGL